MLHADNAPPSVVNSAMIYCLRSMVGTEMPLNAGVLASAQLIIPDGCILKPSFYAAVSSGSVFLLLLYALRRLLT